MSNTKEGAVPESNMPDVKLELITHEGCFAVRIRGNLYVFPEGTSRKDAETAVARGIEIYKGRLN